jgi:hypothetical protein
VAVAVLVGSGTAIARDPAPFSARAGVDIATSAAHAWAADAYLVYLENDEDLTATGTSDRWGYLFYSPGRHEARVYSVRDGRILHAEDFTVRVDPPPVASEWVDSQAAFAVAEEKAGVKYRTEHAGASETMLLMRGAFHDRDPNATTWTVVYRAPDTPSLFVVVDALTGKVARTWRG